MAITDFSPRAGGLVHSFAAQYQQQHKTVRLYTSYDIRQKPILLTQLGQQVPPNQSRVWLTDALDIMRERYPEIRGILLSPNQIRTLTPAVLSAGRPINSK